MNKWKVSQQQSLQGRKEGRKEELLMGERQAKFQTDDCSATFSSTASCFNGSSSCVLQNWDETAVGGCLLVQLVDSAMTTDLWPAKLWHKILRLSRQPSAPMEDVLLFTSGTACASYKLCPLATIKIDHQ